MKPFTIYLTHHSHCDLGYTHDLPIVRELQRRTIDDALDLVDLYPDHGHATFRWTCEVTGIVEHWLRTASPRQIERFTAAAKRGQMEVCALWCNLTPLATAGQLVEMIAPLHRLRRELGLDVRAAMNSDVNGFSWALAGLLRDAGIEGLTMSINEHFGGAPQPFPGLFRWQTPTGASLPVMSGPTYAHTAWLGFGGDVTAAHTKVMQHIAHQQKSGWPHPWLYMQITHHGPQNDNMGPIAHLSPWIEQFNAAHGDTVRLELTTPSRFFRTISSEAAAAPLRSGEWNDWWAFGVGSTPYETALFRRATARLEEADLLATLGLPRNHADLRAGAWDALAHYIEHTWGADCSVHQPKSDDARVQGRHKDRFAYAAWSSCRLLRRDGLSALADRVSSPSTGPALLIFNPSAYSRRESLTVPRRFLEALNLPANASNTPAGQQRWPRDGAWQHFVDRPLFGGQPSDEVGPFDLPAFGWQVIPATERSVPAPALKSSPTSLTNGSLTLQWKAGQPGLASVHAAGQERASGITPFGGVLCEEVTGDRGTIMVFDDRTMPVTTRLPVWNPAPPVQRHTATEIVSRVETSARTLRLIQEMSLPHTDGVTVTWQLSADHNDLEVSIEVRKRPEARPHSLWFALPFKGKSARRLIATAGLMIDPDHELIPNGCPWWSIQEGFAVGTASASATVATPDAPMIAFGKLPLGPAGKDNPADDGLAYIWLCNNYWETNFKADDSATTTYRLRLAFADEAPSAASILRAGSLARHPLAYHPLPEPAATSGTWPAAGSLFTVATQTVQIAACLPGDKPGTFELTLANPGNTDDTFTLSGPTIKPLTTCVPARGTVTVPLLPA